MTEPQYEPEFLEAVKNLIAAGELEELPDGRLRLTELGRARILQQPRRQN